MDKMKQSKIKQSRNKKEFKKWQLQEMETTFIICLNP